MRVTLTFKTPDVLNQVLCHDDDPTAEEQSLVDFVSSKVKYGEYIYVLFDSEAKTAKVVEL